MKNPPIRLQDFVFLAVFISVLASGAQMLSIDSDLGRHLTLGEYIIEHRLIPTRDIFSHTLTGESRPPYEWLSQVVFAISHRLLGLDGIILLTALIISIAIATIFHQGLQRSSSPLASVLVTLLATTATSIHWLPRPHIVTFLFLALWINALEGVRKNGSPVYNGKDQPAVALLAGATSRRFWESRKNECVNLYFFPVLMLFWSNLHGGFIFGFLALAAYFAGWLWERWRGRAEIHTGKSFLLIGLTSLVASVITPDLWRNWEAVLNNRSAFILSRTAETMPPNFTDPSTAPFVLLFALAVIFSLTNRRTVPAAHIFLLGGLGAMSLLMARNIPLFSIACAPLLSEWISAKANQFSAWKNLENRYIGPAVAPSLLFPAVVIMFAVGFFFHRHSEGRQTFQFDPQVFPVRAVDSLEENPLEGRMFNEFNWGGYLLYRLWPRDLVFVDSQSDFYGESLMRDYEKMMLAQNDWRDLLDLYQIDWVIVSAGSPLAAQLEKESGWATLYRDPAAVILQRK